MTSHRSALRIQASEERTVSAKRLGFFTATIILIAAAAAFAARVGQAAPDFVATDSNGQQHHLADYRGKFVVLE